MKETKLNRKEQKLNELLIGEVIEQDGIRYEVCYKNESQYVLVIPNESRELKYYVRTNVNCLRGNYTPNYKVNRISIFKRICMLFDK